MIWKVGVSDRPQTQKDTEFLSPKTIFYYLFLFFDLMKKYFVYRCKVHGFQKKGEANHHDKSDTYAIVNCPQK